MTINLNDFLNQTYTGYTGSQGNLGYTGSTGAGYTGSQGSQGTLGYTGSTGAGYTGSTGSFNSSEAIFTGSIQEQTFALTDAATITIEPANGSIQYLTALGASRTIDVTNFVDGEVVTLMINDNSGSGSVTTWTTVEWVNNGGSAPAWPDSGNYTVIALWKVNGTVYGALVGDGS